MPLKKGGERVQPIRHADGRIKEWPGGRDIKSYTLKWQRNNQHGIRTHIGQVFANQYGRPPRVGDIVRTKTKDGTYHRGAFWYVRTRYGWRVTDSTVRPSAAKIRTICESARPSRKR